MGHISITLNGRLAVLDEKNKSLLPVGAKHQGLIALLATAKNFERGRVWLQDKLWSDRGQIQGAASLRQAIHKTKASLGDLGGILYSNRNSVGLDPSRTDVIQDPSLGEFLEGLDVRDQEFESWLTTMRAAQWTEPAQLAAPIRMKSLPAPRKVVLHNDTNPDSNLAPVSFAVLDQIALSLRESSAVEIGLNTKNLPQETAICVCIHCFGGPEDQFAFRITAEDLQRNTLIFGETIQTGAQGFGSGLGYDILNLCNRTVEAVQDYAAIKSQPLPYDTDAALLANIGIRKIFSICPHDLETAEQLLKQAFEIEPRGIYKAWLAQALVIKHVERFSKDPQRIAEETDQLCADALATEPNNSQVLAAVANARCMIDKNVVAGLELAKLAVQVNASNPLAWWSLSNGFCYAGKTEMAYEAALHAQKLAKNTRFKFWTDIQRALTAIPLDKKREAIAFCELSNSLAPNFRPPKRYLTALYAATDNLDGAHASLETLRTLEPDFELEQMVSDPEYPVGLMRMSGLSESLKKIA